MKEYKAGDVIAFRVVGPGGLKGSAWLSGPENYIYLNHDGSGGSSGHTLERIPNPKLMDGEWWKGWTWRRQYGNSVPLRPGELVMHYSYNQSEEKGDIAPSRTGNAGAGCFILSPPPSGPCPKLKAKIDKMEQELAALKREALG